MEDYDILHVIGSGSFGRVFKCRKKSNDTIVALKKISKAGRSEREIKSLGQECDIQKELARHPNIIQMLDSFETDDSVIVVTEYAQGDLYKLLLAEGPLKQEKVQLIACHIVSALYFLHSHRTLHRDIKPQNILIGLDGKAKLCDFGFARTMGINTYMLTSIKGTPLYMAPEIVQEKPYDHNADLWSLGCILYELMVGNPPFFTTSLFQLVSKIRHEAILWPEFITGDCLSFLQGLLEKDGTKRLTWPALLTHPFVREGVFIDKSVKEFSLTKALSESQEVAKEKQRQVLERKLSSYSKLLAKTRKKFEDAQKELKRCSQEGISGGETRYSSPSAIQTGNLASALPPHVVPRAGHHHQHRGKATPTQSPGRHGGGESLKVMFQNLKVGDTPGKKNSDGKGKPVKTEETRKKSASSCETMSSSTESDTGSDVDTDDAHTVILDGSGRRCTKKSQSSDRISTGAVSGGSLWKSGALFTLHSFGSEDKPINSDEWIYFLMNTMKEAFDNPNSLCEKHFLTMIVSPLRNHLTEPEVIEKIAVLLSLPFTMDDSFHASEPGFMSSLQTLYLETKVIPNLLYSCKLIVRRRRMERGTLSLEEIPGVLTAEDLEALEKCLRVVTFLVHTDEDFVTQFCDSVCVLQAFPILQLFLKLDVQRAGLAADIVAILSQVLRIYPSNKSIIEEVLLDDSDGKTSGAYPELWRLIQHSNPRIQSRSLRVFAYLCHNSEKVKTEILDKNKAAIWKILRRAAISPQRDIRQTAEFVLQVFNSRSSLTMNSSWQSGANIVMPVTESEQAYESLQSVSASVQANCGEIPLLDEEIAETSLLLAGSELPEHLSR